VLEVGSGTGAFLMAVLHQGQSGWGLDLCESLVKAGPRLGVDQKRIRVGVAEGFRLPIASNSFDKVLCYSVTQHFPNHDYAKQCIAELVRVCKDGGVVLMGDICGILEGRRRALIRRGLPPLLADSILLPLIPIRYLRWLPLKRQCSHWLRSYRRSFFIRVLKKLPCSFEILDQDIPGRNESAGRFDVRIRKKSSACLAACLAGVFLAMTSQTWPVVLQQLS
jgi:ubiquinone/menaquinone biosynthesis C-methylase UbiE